MSHANARLTPMGRLLIIQRIQGGMPQAHVAAQMSLSRATVAKWWKRWQADGEPGLVDRSSRPHRSPRRTEAAVEAKVCRLRRTKRLGPARIGARLGVPASTVHRVLVRNGLNRLSHIDRPTGRVIRRYERPHPGDLVHLDVKKVGKVPPGGGWRAHGRSNTPSRGSKKRDVTPCVWSTCCVSSLSSSHIRHRSSSPPDLHRCPPPGPIRQALTRRAAIAAAVSVDDFAPQPIEHSQRILRHTNTVGRPKHGRSACSTSRRSLTFTAPPHPTHSGRSPRVSIVTRNPTSVSTTSNTFTSGNPTSNSHIRVESDDTARGSPARRVGNTDSASPCLAPRGPPLNSPNPTQTGSAGLCGGP